MRGGLSGIVSLFRKAGTTLLQTVGGITGIQIGSKSLTIADDGANNLEIKNTEAGKDIYIDGKNLVEIHTDGTSRLTASGTYIQVREPIYPMGDKLVDLGTTTRRFDNIISYRNSILHDHGEEVETKAITEELTIPVASGAGGVPTVTNMIPQGAVIMGVVGRVTQAPGGGATSMEVCVTGDGNGSLGTAVGVALNTTFTQYINGDGNRSAPWGNGAATTITITTDNNVTVSDMKVRLTVFYNDFTAPTS